MSDTNLPALGGGLPQWMKPTTIDGAMQLAEMFSKSDFVPNAHKGKPGNILVAMQVSASLDVPLLPVLQNIAVINGRPCVWGDFALALCKRHPDWEDIDEQIEETPQGVIAAVCTIKRRGQATPATQRFSKADAQLAGLWDKAGPWKQYPKRMLTMRARSWAMRSAFPDALLGLSISEEAQDIPPEQSASVTVSKSGVSAVRAALGITTEPATVEVTDLRNAAWSEPAMAESPPAAPQTMDEWKTELAREGRLNGCTTGAEFVQRFEDVLGKGLVETPEDCQRMIEHFRKRREASA